MTTTKRSDEITPFEQRQDGLSAVQATALSAFDEAAYDDGLMVSAKTVEGESYDTVMTRGEFLSAVQNPNTKSVSFEGGNFTFG